MRRIESYVYFFTAGFLGGAGLAAILYFLRTN